MEEYVEVGLGNAPTLANLGTKTLRLPEFAGNDTVVYNVGRDEGRVYMTDTDSLVPDDEPEETAAPVETAPAGGSAVAKLGSDAVRQCRAEAAQTPAGSVAGQSTAPADSSRCLQSGSPRPAPRPVPPSPTCPSRLPMPSACSWHTPPRCVIDQIGSNDTTDTLTNGVSSRRNQLLMDISSELGVASVDGAAEATLDKLAQIVNKAAPNYKPFGAVLSEALRDRLRSLFGAAGVKQQYIRDRVANVWQLGEGWVASVLAALLLDTREGCQLPWR